MAYNPQQRDLEILRQSNRNVYLKIDLLDRSFKTIGNVEGEATADSYSMDANSDIRTTYNFTLVVGDSSFLIGRDKKIWFNKYIRVYVGFYHQRSREIIWYPMGVFLFDKAGYSYNNSTKELSLSCVDRMSELTGDRNGLVSGLSTKIPMGSSIRTAIKDSVIKYGNVTKYRIEDIGKKTPIDLEYNSGVAVSEIVKELRDFYPGWETFFDDEYFICQPYPTCLSDPIVLDAATIEPLVISESIDTNFTEMHNVAEVWGKCLETNHYSGTVTYSNNIYSATYGTVPSLTDGTMFGFLASNDSLIGCSFKVDNFTAYPIIGENNTPIAAGRIKANSMYVVKYVVSGSSSNFYFCGEYQICSVAKLVSKTPTAEKIAEDIVKEPTRNITYIVEPTSPFCCDLEGMGEVRQVFADGDYANIYSEDLATQRAKYEVWKATDMLDGLTLEMLEIPWLGVNQKIEYKSNMTGLTQQYITKTKSGSSTGGTMSVQCVKFQPLYPWTT
ncbi:MAG: DUF5048 domain-containing protein [Oscillospiraceae bacterium]